MATYKEYGIAPEIYSGTTNVSTINIDVDPSAYMTEIWGYVKPVNQTGIRGAFAGVGQGQYDASTRVMNSGTTSTFHFDNNYFTFNYFSLGSTSSNPVHCTFQLKYFSENSNSSPFVAPWVYIETFYESNTGTPFIAKTVSFMMESAEPNLITIYPISGDIDRYYLHKITTLEY